jgi:Arc/MetJ-type ribon-helix-helix transcriptional regulator
MEGERLVVPTRTCGTMTISLPPAMLAKIEHARMVEDRTRSEFVRQAIRVYLARSDGGRLGTGEGAVDATQDRAGEAAGAPSDDDELGQDGKLGEAVGRAKDRF